MSIRRVAVVFDATDRPETTGVYVHRALNELVEATHMQPQDLHHVSSKQFDLFLQVDDGHDYVMPSQLRPAAFWAIDTHMDFERYRRSAQHFDLMFTAQLDGSKDLNRLGIAATWLPLACDPAIHRKHDVKKDHDLCFIGNLIPGPRLELVSRLKSAIKNMLLDRRYFEEMAMAYSESRLVFNRSIKNDINMRVFEAVACGSLLLTNDLSGNGQEELFRNEVHLATYQDADELLDKVRYYLKQERRREKIAKAGLQEAYAKHTYRHRVEQILAAAEKLESQPKISLPAASAKGTGYTSDSMYYGYVRPEILALVPTTAQRILDIGCGAGRLGRVIKERQGAEVLGIEYTPVAAAQARTNLDKVFEGDIETLAIDIAPSSLDAVICADVLEHLRNPLTVLRRVRTWMRQKGRLIVSLPNVRHHSVVRGLLEGHWTYEPAGLLDTTHLRFFTRREAEKFLFRAGFDIHEKQMVPGAEHAEWERQGRKGEVILGRLHIGGMSPEEAEEFHAYQYLFTATPKVSVDYGLTSIILVTHNGLPDNRECISSLLQLTDEPYELICIDNGSTDGTPKYLESLANTRVIRNDHNRGFPAAVNQGLTLAHGRQILLLNNDTVLTTGWLTRLLAALYSHERIGLAGPVSNCAPGAQRVQNIPYGADLIGMDGFAWDLSQSFAGLRLDVETLSGFCLLIRSELLAQLGSFDERFGIGTMEDDDFCLRARKAGWRAVVAQDVYLHHSGHRTFQALGMDFDALAARNVTLFQEKWSNESGQPVSLPWSKTSIILVTHGQLSHTKACIESIRHHTPEPYELIVVDNASPDETRTWLGNQRDVTLVANPDNRGFPAAANQGMRMATGEQLLLLNNDTVVTPGWLGRLLTALTSASEIGLCGPCSNRISGEQQVPVDYDQETLLGLNAFAERWRQAHVNQRVMTDRLVGFCLLIKRSVIDKIGWFDEQFGIGNFEDDDYCLRALQEKFQLVIARDVFIHHVGNATFRGAGIDFAGLMQKNLGLFRRKWGRLPQHSLVPVQPRTPAPVHYQLVENNSNDLLIERSDVVLSVCIIAKDNGKTIVPCLESIRSYADEVIVDDTGSTDNTVQLAQACGARVYHFPWCDNFSAARNDSLQYARGKWIFWMDTDDVISPECGRRLRELAYSQHPDHVMGYIMQVHCPGPGPDGHLNMNAVDHVKLFRNRTEFRFDGRIHEQILPALRSGGGEILWTDIYVTHAGYDHSPEGQKRKLARDLKLLHLELQERPEHTFTLFNLGMTYLDTEESDKAIDFLERSIAAAGSNDSHLRKAYALLAAAWQKAGRYDEADAVCRRGLQRFPVDTELRFRRGLILQDLGHHEEAIALYCDLLSRKEPRHLTSVEPGLNGFKTWQNLAVALSATGDLAGAETIWRQMVAEIPQHRSGWRGLADCLLRQNRSHEVVSLARQIVASHQLPGEGELLLGHATAAVGDLTGATEWYRQAAEYLPEDPEPLQSLAKLHFEHGNPNDVLPVLERLLQHHPADAAALHNLGSIHMHAKRFEEAAKCFRQSLIYRPHAPHTLRYLATSLRKLGDDRAADEAQHQAELLEGRTMA